MMSSFRWTNCNVFCNRFPYFPKAIPFPAKTNAKKDSRCAERVGNKPKPTKIGCRYKATDKHQTTKAQAKGGRSPHHLHDRRKHSVCNRSFQAKQGILSGWRVCYRINPHEKRITKPYSSQGSVTTPPESCPHT